MSNAFLISLFLIIGMYTCPAQIIDNLMLDENEIPNDYTETEQLSCITPNAFSLYDQSELYENSVGKVVRKSFQTFQKKGDCGTVLYFEFEDEFKAKAFLDNMLWGKADRPTKNEQDNYYAKGKILVIWSFQMHSPIEGISREKVMKLLR